MLKVNSSKGIVLVEAVIGILVLAFIGLAISYSSNKLVVAQYKHNVLSLVSQQVKQDTINGDFFQGCPTTGSTITESSINVTTNVNLTQTKTCAMQNYNVTVAGKSVNINIPKVSYSISSSKYIGSDAYKVSN